MGWDKIEGKRTDQAGTVRISIHSPSGTNPYHSMRIYVGRTVVQQLGWNNGVNVEAYHGTGKDKGRMSLRRADSGRFTMKFTKKAERGSLHISTNNMPPGVPQLPRGVTVATHIVLPDSSLEFTVPPVFYNANVDLKSKVGRPKISKNSGDNHVDKTVVITGKVQNEHLTSRPNGNAGV